MENNIDQLIAAERDANTKISNAEQKKSSMLEEAKATAEQESQGYKRQKEAELASRRVDTSEYENKLNAEVANVKRQNEKDYNDKKADVIEMIANKVINVNLQLQRNVIGDYAAMNQSKALAVEEK